MGKKIKERRSLGEEVKCMCCIVPMDRPHPWIKYLSIEIGTISWSYSTHLIDISKILIFYFTSSIIYIIKIDKKNIINYLLFYLLKLNLLN